ncbi:nuclear transport factor 2 family protein [Aurantiacibacter flavus]|uniref:Nuclear transport factor 2 family protein n=1 Tax=Aurantiacibacter flavus TaxID=3145232 RepID=A0ABV0CYH2_9SPHN
MTRLVFAGSLAIALAACGQASTEQPDIEADKVSQASALLTFEQALVTTDRESLSDREVSDRFIKVFYDNNELVKGFEAWVHPDYIQHDPNSPTGRDATIAVLADHMAANPEMTLEVKRVIYGDKEADGTLVAVHYHFKRAPEERGLAVVDIYRVKDGYLVEHWDVLQPVPEEALNENTMF